MPRLALHERCEVPVRIDNLPALIHRSVVHLQVRRQAGRPEVGSVYPLAAELAEDVGKLLRQGAFIRKQTRQGTLCELRRGNHGAAQRLRQGTD